MRRWELLGIADADTLGKVYYLIDIAGVYQQEGRRLAAEGGDSLGHYLRAIDAVQDARRLA